MNKFSCLECSWWWSSSSFLWCVWSYVHSINRLKNNGVSVCGGEDRQENIFFLLYGVELEHFEVTRRGQVFDHLREPRVRDPENWDLDAGSSSRGSGETNGVDTDQLA